MNPYPHMLERLLPQGAQAMTTYLHISVDPAEYDRSEYSNEAVIDTDGDTALIWEPITSVDYDNGRVIITFPDGDTISDPSWARWSVVGSITESHFAE